MVIHKYAKQLQMNLGGIIFLMQQQQLSFYFVILKQQQLTMKPKQAAWFKGSSTDAFNPETRQDVALSILNERIFEQAEQVKHHLRNKSSTRTNSQLHNQYCSDMNTRNYTQRAQNSCKNGQNHKSCDDHQWTKSNKKTIKNNQSLKKLFNTDLEQSALCNGQKKSIFEAITIHSLREKRHQLEDQINKIQTYQSYTLTKIDKMKRIEQKRARQIQKYQRLIQQKRQSQREINEAKLQHQESHRRRNQLLKSQVLNHRLQKDYIIQKTIEQKRELGNTCRMRSLQLSEFHQEQSTIQKEQKQMLFMKEKAHELKHKQDVARINEQRRNQARFRFKKKWFQEFQSVHKSRNEAQYKKDQLAQKIRQALRSHSKALTQQ